MTGSAATIRPLPPADRYLGRCGLCGDHSLLRLLTHFDTELPLGSQHLCGACCQHVVTADVALNCRVGLAAPLALCRPPRGCEADGNYC